MSPGVAGARCLFAFILAVLTAEAKGSIPVPRNLTATFVEPNKIHVSWQAPEDVSGVFSYNVTISTTGVLIRSATVGNTVYDVELELSHVCKNYTIGVAVLTTSMQVGNYSSDVTLEDCELVEVHFEVTLKDEAFHQDLEDIHSKSFQNFSTRFKNNVETVLTHLSDDVEDREVDIISIRGGSVIVYFKIIARFPHARLGEKITKEIWNLVLNPANSGSLGNLTVSKIVAFADPPPPEGLEAIDIKKDRVTVKWRAPTHAQNFNISGYSVQMKKFEESYYTGVGDVTEDQHELEVPDLDSESEYLFEVLSHRPGGYSPGISQTLEVRTRAAGLQGWAVALIVIAVLALVVAAVVAAVYYRRRRRRRAEQQLVFQRRENHYTYGPRSENSSEAPLQVALPQQGFDRLWKEISRDAIRMGEELGSGAFGVVMKGYLTQDGKTMPCAIKTVKQNFTENELRDLVNEVNRMATVGNHPNVVSLYGACSEGGPLWIVVKFAENGCLLNYLQKHRKQVYNDYQNVNVNPEYQNVAPKVAEEDSGRLNYVEKLKMARGIAKGMQHLERMKCVHRDLAARNILLGKNNLAMVSDFGLARDVYESGAYENTSGGKLPVRWMAIESLDDYIYTTQTDVWAYGIVLWEIETEGNVPYPGIGGGMEILKELKNGYRLPKPEECSDEMYAIMHECWDADPKKRPTFKKIVEKVEDILGHETGYVEFEDDENSNTAPYDEVTFPSDMELDAPDGEQRAVEINGLPPV